MTRIGITLMGAGVGAYFFGWIGRQVERKWNDLDPGSQPLSSAQQFALARQRAVMRQGPFFRSMGLSAVALGLLLLVVSWAVA